MIAAYVPLSTVAETPFSRVQWIAAGEAIDRADSGAKWIWVQRPGEAAPTARNASAGDARFVREWVLEGKPVSAEISFAVDNSCTVKINGKVVGSSDRWDTLKKVDVTEYLKAGSNRIEVTANNLVATGLNPGGFLLEGAADLGAGKRSVLVSNSEWTGPDGKTVEIGGFDSEPWHLTQLMPPCPIFRRVFAPARTVKRAVAHVIGLGHYDLYVNGKRQGDGILNQPWSQYDKTIYWQDFDVTKSVKAGQNVMGLMMGNGFYVVGGVPAGRFVRAADGRPDFSNGVPWRAAVNLELTYSDGSKETVGSDKNWQWKSGPYVLSNEFAGEDYDARQMPSDWMDAKATGWRSVQAVDAPKATLRHMDWPHLKEVQSWKPVKINEVRPGVWTYAFPQNASAILRFKVKGKRGAEVIFKPSEVMTEKGEVEQLNLWGGASTGNYILKGGGSEVHEWRFFYHGFQFVEMTGAVPAGKPNPKGLPVLESLEMVHTRTDNEQIGEFATSNKVFNGTHALVDWAIRSNMSYVMTDCPHREKAGWLECSHLLFASFAYRYDVKDWYRKIARDIRDSQLADGNVATVAPRFFVRPAGDILGFTVEWGAASVFDPYYAYQWYGDKSFLTENYSMMKRYVDYIESVSPDGIAPVGLGDWYDYGHGQAPGPSRFTPTNLSSTAMWAMCVDAVKDSAKVLGKSEDVERYTRLKARIKDAFLKRFFDFEFKEFFNSGSVQTGHAMALCAGLVPEGDRGEVLQRIIDDLEKRGYQQTPGDVGHVYFIRALAEAGRSDVLHKVYSRTGLGSYGGILAKGLTAMPETWDAITVGSNSLNHCMLGHVMEWFYGYVLGIRQEVGSVGFADLVIAPEPGELSHAEGKTSTVRGQVKVAWRRSKSEFRLEAVVPKGAPARVVLPSGFGKASVDGRAVQAVQGWQGRATVKVPAGRHVVIGRG